MNPVVTAELARYAELTGLYRRLENALGAENLDLVACQELQTAITVLIATLQPATAFADRPPTELRALAEAAADAQATRDRVAKALRQGQERRRTGAGTQTRDAAALRRYAGAHAAIPRYYDAQG
jgi:hypothetical protein